MIEEKSRFKEFVLRNKSGMEVRILNYGGTIKNLFVPGKDGGRQDIVLGFDNANAYTQKENPYFGCITGRFANRIAGGRLSINGNDYQLSTNDGSNTLHGGAVGFNRYFWDSEFDEAGNTLQLYLVSPDGDQGFPGSLSAAVTYRLSEDNELSISYEATTDQPTAVNLTNHSYFNLSGGTDATVEDHEMQIFAEKYIPVNDEFIPTGIIAAVEGTPMDFRSPVKIGKDLKQVPGEPGGYDHTWVLTTEDRTSPELAAAVYHPASGRYMQVLTTQPGVQFYSGNFLDGTLEGKKAVYYAKHAGFCLETQHFPDSPNQPTFPNTILNPGELFHQTTVFRFSIRS